MGILGGFLIVLALPLFIGYAISDKKSKNWLNLGLIMGGVGLVIVLLSAIVR